MLCYIQYDTLCTLLLGTFQVVALINQLLQIFLNSTYANKTMYSINTLSHHLRACAINI